MTTAQRIEQREEISRLTGEALAALIGEQVLHALGRPGDLWQVQVRPLWEGRYRANVFVGADVVSARVAHSYFLTVDGDGAIVASSPQVTRTY